MTHKRSIAHHYFPLNIQVLEKNSVEKVVPLVKTNTKNFKNIHFAHIT